MSLEAALPRWKNEKMVLFQHGSIYSILKGDLKEERSRRRDSTQGALPEAAERGRMAPPWSGFSDSGAPGGQYYLPHFLRGREEKLPRGGLLCRQELWSNGAEIGCLDY